MTEYIIDVDVDKARFSEDGTKIQLVPAVLKEIVRCRDCIYFDKYPNDEITVCYRFDNEEPEVAPDGFCAWGERRKS